MPLESTPLLSIRVGGDASASSASPAPRRCGRAFDIALTVSFSAALVGCAAFSVFTLVDLALTARTKSFLEIVSGLSLPFLLCTLPVSLHDIAQHLAHYEHTVQRLYVRILLMVPIYASESYAALRAPRAHFVLETLRETYECIALLAVFWLAVETLGSRRDAIAVLSEGAETFVARSIEEEEGEGGGEGGAGRAEVGGGGRGSPGRATAYGDGLSRTERFLLGLLDGSAFTCGLGGGGAAAARDAAYPVPLRGVPTVRLMLPFCCLGRWKLGATFFHRCHLGVAQYVVVRIVCSLITVITSSLGTYGEGIYDAGAPALWLTIAINLSQLWALYCLIFFAAVLWPALRPMKPLGKFLLVKVVVFGFWWQSVMMGILADWGALKALEPPEQSAQAKAEYETSLVLQDALIAVECLLIAIAHHYTFGLRDFRRADFQWALGRKGRTRAAAEAADARKAAAPRAGGGGDVSPAPGGGAALEKQDSLASEASDGAATPALRPNVGSDLLFLDVAVDSAAVVRSAGTAAVDAIRAIASAASASPTLLRRKLLSSEPGPAEAAPGPAAAGAVVPGDGAGMAAGADHGSGWAVVPNARL
jgi:hypothetical protein